MVYDMPPGSGGGVGSSSGIAVYDMPPWSGGGVGSSSGIAGRVLQSAHITSSALFKYVHTAQGHKDLRMSQRVSSQNRDVFLTCLIQRLEFLVGEAYHTWSI